MITLNLLPPEERKNSRLEQFQRWILFYAAAIFVVLVIFAGLLGGLWYFILTQQKTIAGNLLSIQSNSWGQTLIEQRNIIQQTNQALEKINRLQKNHKYYSALLIKLTGLIPEKIKISSFSIDKDNTIILYGFAPQRDQILVLDENLKKAGIFENIFSPISNLTKQSDINFYFKFNLKPGALNF